MRNTTSLNLGHFYEVALQQAVQSVLRDRQISEIYFEAFLELLRVVLRD
jgi:hypothetical protein